MGFFLSFWINLQFLLRSYWCKTFSCKPVVQEQVISKALDADRLMTLVNTWRESQNYQPYIKKKELCVIAQARVEELPDIASYIDHSGLFKKYSNYPSVLSENLVGGRSLTEEKALDSWLQSPSHKAALEQNYRFACISCKYSNCVHIMSSCENGCP